MFNNHVILGTRARKTRTKSFQAFSSINYPDLGILRDGVLLRYIRQDCTTVPTFSDTLDNKVALLKLTPGQDRSAADFFLERNDALIIESFGVGGLPEHGGFYDCLPVSYTHLDVYKRQRVLDSRSYFFMTASTSA